MRFLQCLVRYILNNSIFKFNLFNKNYNHNNIIDNSYNSNNSNNNNNNHS